jgi:microcystin-dependent protein
MTRPTLLDGQIWEANYANAAGFPQMTGEDTFGHGPLIRDENMSDVPGQLKPQFYGWYNRINVTATTGLSVAYTGAAIRLANGTTVDLPSGVLVLPNNATGWVYINSAGAIQVGATLPVQGIVLASYVTAASAITQLNDLRYQVVETVAPLQIDTQSAFDIGDIKPSARQNPSNGWLRMDGAEYAVSAYPLLYSAIGIAFNKPTTPLGFFRVPDSRNRALAGAGDVRALGQEWGEETKRLSVSEMPTHSHGATSSAHSHGVYDGGHAHNIYDAGHAHSIAPYRPYAEGNGNRGSGAELTAIPKAGIPSAGTQVATTGIGIHPANSNISLEPAAISVTVSNQGGGAAFSVAQPSTALNWYIRAF